MTTPLNAWLTQQTGLPIDGHSWDVLCAPVLVAMFLTVVIRARPNGWEIFQFIISVIGGILFVVAWNTVGPGAHPFGQEGQLLPIFALIAGYWFNKTIMFCIIWARFGFASARSMRMLD